MADYSAITLVENAIHNPTEPRHFMQVVPAGGRQTVSVGDHVIADSANAVVVKEVGRGVYDPVVYFPREDIEMDALVRLDKSTHCPLKGDTEYFDVVVGDERIPEAAWSYVKMILGDELLELVSFDGRKVTHGTRS